METNLIIAAFAAAAGLITLAGLIAANKVTEAITKYEPAPAIPIEALVHIPLRFNS